MALVQSLAPGTALEALMEREGELWPGSLFHDLATEDRDLMSTVLRLAVLPKLGTGNRALKDVAHAGLLLGPERVRQVATWRLMLGAAGVPGHWTRKELLTTGAAAAALAEECGMDVYAAVTCGMGARMARCSLLRDREEDVKLIGMIDTLDTRVLERFERRLFGLTTEEEHRRLLRRWDLPHDLKGLLQPPPKSSWAGLGELAVKLVRDRHAGRLGGDHTAYANELGRAALEKELPWAPCPAPQWSEVAVWVAELLARAERGQEDLRVQRARSESLAMAVEAVAEDVAEQILPIPQGWFLMRQEVARAKRHRRSLALVVLSATQGPQNPELDERPLRAIGRILREVCRTGDHVLRLDQKHLAVVLPETGVHGARSFMGRLDHAFRAATDEGQAGLGFRMFAVDFKQVREARIEALVHDALDGLDRMAESDERVGYSRAAASLFRAGG